MWWLCLQQSNLSRQCKPPNANIETIEIRKTVAQGHRAQASVSDLIEFNFIGQISRAKDDENKAGAWRKHWQKTSVNLHSIGSMSRSFACPRTESAIAMPTDCTTLWPIKWCTGHCADAFHCVAAVATLSFIIRMASLMASDKTR